MLKVYRTSYCADVSADQVGDRIKLAGWVANSRDLGGLTFVDLRDRSGIIQLLFSPDQPKIHKQAGELNREDVIHIEGIVEKRDKKNVNPNITTGQIEINVSKLEVLNSSDVPPFSPSNNLEVNDVTRLKYRYIDLRNEKMQQNILLRHKIFATIRNFFDSEGFVDIETPILTKSTPEGARDFLVPSRLHKGKFYALPQSPQLFKQLLMISGFDKYYQIAKCFRDEDLRADRQPEFTQLDLEMSFVKTEDIIKTTERMIRQVFYKVLGVELPRPFPRLTHREALNRYGSDKPDLRYGFVLNDLSNLVKNSKFKIFSSTITSGGVVKGLKVKNGAKYSRGEVSELETLAQEHGAKGLLSAQYREGRLQGSFVNHLEEKTKADLNQHLQLNEGDLVLIIAGERNTVNGSLGRLRTQLATKEDLYQKNQWAPVWIVDFPLFGLDDQGNLVSEHHPFTAPQEKDRNLLQREPLDVLAQAYDIVLNGTELGGGSIRIHDRSLQEEIFRILNITKEEAQKKFGFFLQALQYGPPPHGGIALGLDRFTMLAAGEETIRDVIPFPKTGMGQCPLTGAPMEVDKDQLTELGLED